MAFCDLVVAAPLGDSHGDVVFDAVQRVGRCVVRVTDVLLPDLSITSSPSETGATLTLDCGRIVINERTTIWWRRPFASQTEPRDVAPDEKQLITDETRAILPGVLEAASVRWVDAPWTMNRARLKAVQVREAANCGAQVPETLITGCRQRAEVFASGGTTLAKAVSSGIGIAPFVDVIPLNEVFRVGACPSLLQRLVPCVGDVRIATIADRAYAWIRPRASADAIDWRAADPTGRQFAFTTDDPTSGLANKIATKLGLTFSVQDWLLTRDECIFLEVNAQGQWLFLSDAHLRLLPPFIDHLLT